jgi:Cu+-exporting ATPase
MADKHEHGNPSNLVQIGGLGPVPPVVTFEIDPVCKMRVMPETAAATFDYNGKTYYFCAKRCMERFKADPHAFLKAAVPATSPASASDMIYTCPMHPEVRQKGPGSCPKCGMALEPEMAQLEDGPNPELVDMTRRFWTAAVMSVPVVALGMMDMQRTAQFLLATPVVLWAGWPLLQRGAASIVRRSLNMFTLIAMGVSVAYAFSAFAVFKNPALPVYFEAAAVITTWCCSGKSWNCVRAPTPAARSRACWPGSENRTACRDQWLGVRRANRACPCWRQFARTPRREGSGRRGDPRGRQFDRRIDGFRRTHSRRKDDG